MVHCPHCRCYTGRHRPSSIPLFPSAASPSFSMSPSATSWRRGRPSRQQAWVFLMPPACKAWPPTKSISYGSLPALLAVPIRPIEVAPPLPLLPSLLVAPSSASTQRHGAGSVRGASSPFPSSLAALLYSMGTAPTVKVSEGGRE
jgi:hypothetical protein